MPGPALVVRGEGSLTADAEASTVSDFQISLDYPPSAVNAPRWGWGGAPHERIAALLTQGRDRYAASLETIAQYVPDLRRIAVEAEDGTSEPAWRNPFLPGLDGAALYAFVRDRRPRKYLEVGSGNSTRFVARAKRDGGLSTEIVSIDPAPRAEVDVLCDTVERSALEISDLGQFSALEPGDVVFFDGSHRVFMNNDTVTFFLDVLPSLPSGVLVGIHDIFLPEDYPGDWSERWYAEQYLLAAWLLGGGGATTTVLPSYHASARTGLSRVLDPLWETPGFEAVERHGCAFWLTT